MPSLFARCLRWHNRPLAKILAHELAIHPVGDAPEFGPSDWDE
ncbi:MAG: hypothetical protein ABGW79_00605 [Pirellulales bacterium]